jgi:excisionase family DNA binding protein
MDPELLSVAQVAQRLSVTEAAVRKWLAQRRLPVVKLGRLTRVPSYALNVIAEHGLPAPNTYPRPLSPRGATLRVTP